VALKLERRHELRRRSDAAPGRRSSSGPKPRLQASRRKDDNPETFKKRLEEIQPGYSASVVPYYEKRAPDGVDGMAVDR
jgi:adenylate kinase family enzyme